MASEGAVVADLKASLKASELRCMIVELNNNSNVKYRVTGSKPELAERLAAALKAKHPRTWAKKAASLAKGKGVTKRRAQKSQPSGRNPGRKLAKWTHRAGQVSSGIENGWPLFVEPKRLDRAAGGNRMYLVGRSSHSTFLIIGSSEQAYQVNLLVDGSGPTCSCPDHCTRKTVCKHILFTLMRVLRVRKEDLQDGLEKDTVQSAIHSTTTFLVDAVPGWFSQPSWFKASQGRILPEKQVEQRPIENDCTCAICLSGFWGLSPGNPDLVFCRHFCGNSLHRNCFEQQKQYDLSRGADVLCAYCRQPWGP
mmetsp:Transcript_28647/g.80673  ORF Transcript_28647/g.80673 Transcript_28647/m.80673 type:complete len:309 (+) Transcript_28647:234-1160(+)